MFVMKKAGHKNTMLDGLPQDTLRDEVKCRLRQSFWESPSQPANPEALPRSTIESM